MELHFSIILIPNSIELGIYVLRKLRNNNGIEPLSDFFYSITYGISHLSLYKYLRWNDIRYAGMFVMPWCAEIKPSKRWKIVQSNTFIHLMIFGNYNSPILFRQLRIIYLSSETKLRNMSRKKSCLSLLDCLWFVWNKISDWEWSILPD